MSDIVFDRQNGKYTCLDFTRQMTNDCSECKNWNQFDLFTDND